MTRLLLLSILLAGYAKTNAQNGYLITKDSVKKVGYLKYSTNFHTGEREVEFWETFEDDSPQEIPITTLKEYAIEKDTFKIFRHFIPFERRNTTIEFVHTDVIVQGVLNLYSTFDIETKLTTNYDAFVGPSTGNQRIETLILDDNEGNILAIDREYIKADLAKFIGDNEQLMKELLAMKKIKYKKRKIKKLIEKYNAER